MIRKFKGISRPPGAQVSNQLCRTELRQVGFSYDFCYPLVTTIRNAAQIANEITALFETEFFNRIDPMPTLSLNSIMQRYRDVEVWSRYDEDRVIIYRCLQNLSSQKYMVDRAEVVPTPVSKVTVLEIASDQLENFTEEIPENRLGQFASLDEAIEAHDLEFENKVVAG